MRKDGKLILMAYAVMLTALVAFGLILMTDAPDVPTRPSDSRIPWQIYSEEKVAAARKEGKPVIIDFFAVWCGPCRQMDRQVFSRQDVADIATNFVTLRVDVSDDNNEPSRQAAVKYLVNGLPTLVFLGRNGEERTRLRLLGYEEPDRLIQRLKAVD